MGDEAIAGGFGHIREPVGLVQCVDRAVLLRQSTVGFKIRPYVARLRQIVRLAPKSIRLGQRLVLDMRLLVEKRLRLLSVNQRQNTRNGFVRLALARQT